MSRWEPPGKPTQEPFEEMDTKEELRRLLEPEEEMAIHIRREDIPNQHTVDNEKHGKLLKKRATGNIGDILDVFPKRKIEISTREN